MAVFILHLDPFGILRPCPLRALTGHPCPTCGGTEALRDLLGGHVARAFVANPLITAASIAVIASGIAALVVLPCADRVGPPQLRSGRVLLLFLAGAVMMNWAYLLLFRFR